MPHNEVKSHKTWHYCSNAMGSSNRRREDHVRHHNDMPAHGGQAGAEPGRKTARSVLGDLTYYDYMPTSEVENVLRKQVFCA